MPALSPLSVIRATYQRCLKLPYDDRLAPDFLVAALTANQLRMTTDPIWCWFVGPPGSGKNEMLRPYQGSPYAHYESSLTVNAIMSGHKDKDDPSNDPSLLPLRDGKTLIFEDFASLIEMGEHAVNKILGDFRVLYGDEAHSKSSGTAGRREYKSKFGIIFGVTPILDTILSRHQQLGERFISFRIARDAMERSFKRRMQDLRHVRASMLNKAEWRASIAKVAQEGMKTILEFANKAAFIEIPNKVEDQILAMGDCVARLRSAPVRGIPSVPEPGNRISQQLIYLGQGRILADLRDTWSYSDTQFVRRVALDTLPRHVVTIIRELSPGDNSFVGSRVPFQDIVQKTHLASSLLASTIRQYQFVGAVTEDSGRQIVQLSNDQVYQLRRAGLLHGEEGV